LEQEGALGEPFKKLIIPRTYTEVQQREIRLKRLQKLSWQLEYLCCFYVLSQQKFENVLASLSSQQQLEFLATAYNTGFHKSSRSIEQAMHRASYPYGSKYPAAQQYIYAAVAVDYYLQQ
jgi:hypothetical protein